MDPITIAAGVMGLGGGAANAGISYLNYKEQQKMNRYQKQLQQIMFEREDNATQRRVADLKAAGLSPVLAAGSAAGAGPVVQTKAPEMDQVNVSDGLSMAIAAKNIQNQTASTEAQVKLNAEQIKTAKTQRQNIEAQTAKANAEKKILDYEYNLASKSGVSVKGGGLGGTIKNLSGAVSNVYKHPDGTPKRSSEIPTLFWTNNDIRDAWQNYKKTRKKGAGGTY